MPRKYQLTREDLSRFTARVVISASSGYTNYRQFVSFMDEFDKTLPSDHVYISGDSTRGGDAMLVHWGELRRKYYVQFPVDWQKNKRIAGFLRNREMAHSATHVLLFYDGKSNGTKNMLWEANHNKLKTEIVLFDPEDQPEERNLPHVTTHKEDSDRAISSTGFSFRSFDNH